MLGNAVETFGSAVFMLQDSQGLPEVHQLHFPFHKGLGKKLVDVRHKQFYFFAKVQEDRYRLGSPERVVSLGKCSFHHTKGPEDLLRFGKCSFLSSKAWEDW